MTREHPVPDREAHARAVSEYRADGYAVVVDKRGRTVLRYQSRGTLLTHLALFFTVGWLTFGILNLWYAGRKKRQTRDRVTVVTR